MRKMQVSWVKGGSDVAHDDQDDAAISEAESIELLDLLGLPSQIVGFLMHLGYESNRLPHEVAVAMITTGAGRAHSAWKRRQRRAKETTPGGPTMRFVEQPDGQYRLELRGENR